MEATKLEKLKKILEPEIKKEGLILYKLAFTKESGQQTLQVMVCHEDYSLDLDTCEKISDKLSQILDKEDLLPDSYYLDVCSPGAERELLNDQMILAAIDQYVHIELKDPKAGIDKLEGYLRKFADKELLIEYKDKTRTKQLTVDQDNLRLIRLAVKL